MKSMKESGYIDGYTDESTGNIGIEIYGRDAVLLNAPEVRLSPDTPLLTKAQDVAGAINELFQSGTGGGDDIYITSYTDTSLAVTVISDRTAETPEITVSTFSFTLKEFKTVTTAKTSKGESTRTWIKRIITSVANAEGTVIWTLTPNTEGKIIAVYDINGNEILGGITNGDSVITNTPEGVALGYALAYSKEQDALVEKLIDAYEDGVNDESTIGVDDDETDITVTDLEGNGARYYCIQYSPPDTWQYFDCEYIQILSMDSGIMTKVLLKNVNYTIRQDSTGHIQTESECDPPKDFTLTLGDWALSLTNVDMIRLAGTIYDADGNIYTGNMVFNK